MEYRCLGRSGLKVSSLSFGSWITFGGGLDLDAVRSCMRYAYERGVIFFDNAEVYGNGASELLMGEVVRDYPREQLVISTKIFWGGEGANATGTSCKHLIEGTRNSLRRMQLDYVDLLYCHRADTMTPMEETVRAMDRIIKSGQALYWGTSEWSVEQIEEAHRIAEQIGATPPVVEQPEYSMFHREKVEKEFAPLYEKYGMGTTTWSPLDMGILTGKYSNGIPKGSRLDLHDELKERLLPEKLEKVRQLTEVAEGLGCSLSQLAISWCMSNPRVSSVITGASNLKQLEENLGAIEVQEKLTEEVKTSIEKILG